MMKPVSDQELKDIRQASLIPHQSLFKDKVQASIQQMSVEQIERALAGVKWQRRGLLFKAWMQAVLKEKKSLKKESRMKTYKQLIETQAPTNGQITIEVLDKRVLLHYGMDGFSYSAFDSRKNRVMFFYFELQESTAPKAIFMNWQTWLQYIGYLGGDIMNVDSYEGSMGDVKDETDSWVGRWMLDRLDTKAGR